MTTRQIARQIIAYLEADPVLNHGTKFTRETIMGALYELDTDEAQDALEFLDERGYVSRYLLGDEEFFRFVKAPTYTIIRMWRDELRDAEIVRGGVTLAEAQAHCRDPKTSGDGWFDGYTMEVL